MGSKHKTKRCISTIRSSIETVIKGLYKPFNSFFNTCLKRSSILTAL